MKLPVIACAAIDHLRSESALAVYRNVGLATLVGLIAIFIGLASAVLPAILSAGLIVLPLALTASWRWPILIAIATPVLAFGLVPFAALDFSRFTEITLILGTVVALLKSANEHIRAGKTPFLDALRYMKKPLIFFMVLWSIALIHGALISKNHFAASDAKRYIGYLALIIFSFIAGKKPSFLPRIIIGAGTLSAFFLIIQLGTGWKVFAGFKGFMEGGAGSGFEDVARGSAMGGDYLVIFMLFYSLSTASLPGARHRALFAMMIPIYLFGAIATYSRGMWAGLAIAFIIFPIIEYRNFFRASRSLIILTATCAAISVTVYPWAPRPFDAIAGRLQSITGEGGRGTSVGARLDENAKGIESIKSHPILGLGHGGEYKKFTPQAERGFVNEATFIHNSYLWMMVKFGIFGLIFVLALSWKILSEAWRLQNTKSHDIRPLRSGAICFMIAWLTNGMSSPVWAQATDLVALSLIIVMIGTLRNNALPRTGNHEVQHRDMHLEQQVLHPPVR
jgi:O-antigen ligase